MVMGFCLGSILFAYEIPRMVKHVDIRQISEDGNPGTFNAFAAAGVGWGILVLLAELLKGFFPVYLCSKRAGQDSLLKSTKEEKLIIVCGNNAKVESQLKKAFSSCDRAKILGYTTQMNLYMKACDVLFTKPGGLTSTEGAVAGIPMVHTEPIPGCETANRKFFGRLGMSVSAKTIKGQVQAGLKLLSDKEAADEMIRRQQKNINKMAEEDICDFIKGKLTDEKALL